MHMDKTVNNGCLVHFSFAEQVEFLLFPLLWFQPPSGMFLPGHIPPSQLMAFHGVSVLLARASCVGRLCHTEKQTYSEISQTILKGHFSPPLSPRLEHIGWYQDAEVQASPGTQINRNVTMDDVVDKCMLVYSALVCPCVCVHMCAHHTCRVGAPGVP